MSHDKIKTAARERMGETGEPYATARREVIREHQAPGGQLAKLVWINGPSGVGKTTVSSELQRRLPGSAICDPMNLGYGMKKMLPAEMRSGLVQDLPAWRRAVLDLLRVILAGHRGPVIAPMALVDYGHYQEIIGGLRREGVEVHHFALLAEPATVVRRLKARSLGREPRTQPWQTQVLDDWLHRLRQPEFAQHVQTDHRTIAQVADVISESAGLTIQPSADGPVRAWLHRYATTVRSIHWQ